MPRWSGCCVGVCIGNGLCILLIAQLAADQGRRDLADKLPAIKWGIVAAAQHGLAVEGPFLLWVDDSDVGGGADGQAAAWLFEDGGGVVAASRQ